jgi:N-acetylglutamate synthase-like GNAT family acetyltransferase
MPTRDAPSPAPFSEKGFYLQEFRGRTLALAAPEGAVTDPGPLVAVIRELAGNGTRVLLLPEDPKLARDLGLEVLPSRGEAQEGDVWRGLQLRHALALVPEAGDFAAACLSLAARLRIGKFVWLDPAGALAGEGGAPASFVDLDGLRRLRAAGHPRPALLAQIEALLEAGIAAVNVCSAEGLGDELFSYAGSGTLFTRERYLAVRRLGIDDYGAALDLVRRGVEEGYLAPRSEAELDRVLGGAFGAFVEDRFLAGIGALLSHPDGKTGEIASLYTLTRFLGEGVGGHLVAFALEEAGALGLERVFACTTQERVGSFFERNGFRAVRDTALPEERWKGYDESRRARLHCYAADVTPTA